MSMRRHDLLKRLEEAVATVAVESMFGEASTICFQVMYGLPWELQIRAACSACERYLPIFERKWPGVSWPRFLLGDVDAWHRREGRGRPPVADKVDSADAAYYFCFDYLLSAYHYKQDQVSLAAGSCGAIAEAAYATANNTWIDDDPVGAHIEEKMLEYTSMDEEHRPSEPPFSYEQQYDPAHDRYGNAAFVAVYRREWVAAAAWLRAEAVWQQPEPKDLKAMARGLKRWEDHQFLPMGPAGGRREKK